MSAPDFEAARLLARLSLDAHPDLILTTSTDTDWLEYETRDCLLAHWRIDWTEDVELETGWAERHLDHGPDLEISAEPRHELGLFRDLHRVLAGILANPHRTKDSVVNLDVNLWALRFSLEDAARTQGWAVAV